MRHRIALAVCLALLVLVQGTSLAQNKYSQLPKQDNSFSFASSYATKGFVVADDWVCPDGVPIMGISWWGSYWYPSGGQPVLYSDWRPNAISGGVESFSISILRHLPASDPGNLNPFSTPADISDPANVLWTGNFLFAYANETHAFTATIDAEDGVIEREVYNYTVDLGDAVFAQEQGERYWISIVANMADDTKQWGWHEATQRTGAQAVQAGVPIDICGNYDWYLPCGGGYDMAFELIPVPEPGSLLALGAGASGLIGFAIRRRR